MVKLIILILVGTLALSFFGITIQSIVNSPVGQENFAYLGHLLTLGWDYLVMWFREAGYSIMNFVNGLSGIR